MKKTILNLLRKLGLMHGVDRLYFQFNRLRYASRNAGFRKQHPGINLPPDYMLYESYRLDHATYYQDGKNTAQWILEQLKPFAAMEGQRVLDWGCGPARVVRHLPELAPGNYFFGSDYNEATIEWCRNNIAGVDFRKNGLKPPLGFDADFFNTAYALSVFTHLSEENHSGWMNEIHRVLKPGGVFLFTTQGEIFMAKLTEDEKNIFRKDGLVVRAQVREGHRTFSAFHPPNYMHRLYTGKWKVLNFIPGTLQSWGPEQDTWIIQKL